MSKILIALFTDAHNDSAASAVRFICSIIVCMWTTCDANFRAGVIGTGLFLGTAQSLHNGGPLGLLLGYTIVGTICLCVMVSLISTSTPQQIHSY